MTIQELRILEREYLDKSMNADNADDMVKYMQLVADLATEIFILKQGQRYD